MTGGLAVSRNGKLAGQITPLCPYLVLSQQVPNFRQ
jgi:hypothetical protein